MKLTIRTEEWPCIAPLRITGHVFTSVEVVVATINDGEVVGRGEASGIYYRGETQESIVEQLESVRGAIEAGVSREALRRVLPPGGARNALDCALWDFEAGRAGKPVWSLAGLREPRPLFTTITVGADSPTKMAETARSCVGTKALKLKLTQEDPASCVRAVRAARPDVWLGVDANRGFTRELLEALLPTFQEVGIRLIEQPFPLGRDADLDGLNRIIPIAADESVQGLADIKAMAGRYDVINIKLDKCGGLTEGLMMVQEIRRLNLKPMVGCTLGTSLAMAPAFILGQLCDLVDLDAPLVLTRDREHAAQYSNGQFVCPDALWGGGLSSGVRRSSDA
jgi:L-Ala-D/L-Glu epimerase